MAKCCTTRLTAPAACGLPYPPARLAAPNSFARCPAQASPTPPHPHTHTHTRARARWSPAVARRFPAQWSEGHCVPLCVRLLLHWAAPERNPLQRGTIDSSSAAACVTRNTQRAT